MASGVSRHGPTLRAGATETDLGGARRILVAGIGKAAFPMWQALRPHLPEGKASAVVVAPEGFEPAPGVRWFSGGHPYPNEHSDAAARHLLRQASLLGPEDLFICLLSGGGSAICEAPLDDVTTLAEMRALFEVLVTCGAGIVDVNIVRKHLSRIKGGRLAEAAFPARQLTLYVSDVPPDAPSSVASGPTMPDSSTCQDAYSQAERHGITARLPARIRARFEDRSLVETPKPGSEVFSKSQWACLSDNAVALESLESRSRRLGWLVERDLSVDDQPVDLAADTLLDRLVRLARANPGRTVAVSTGGELSSPVRGDGMGGRNQAFVLWASRKIAGRGIRATVLSAGTDGIDGNSPAAGAVADQRTVPRALRMGLDPAGFGRRSDSYHFFRDLDDLIMTGPTGNNVRDLRMLVAPPER